MTGALKAAGKWAHTLLCWLTTFLDRVVPHPNFWWVLGCFFFVAEDIDRMLLCIGVSVIIDNVRKGKP